MAGRKKGTNKSVVEEDDYFDEECDYSDVSCYNDDDEKNKHGVEFNLSVNSKDADIVRSALMKAGHVKIADKLEIKRELAIMHEVWDTEGKNIYQKIDNCLEKWRKDEYACGVKDTREPKYKMVHKVLAK